MDQTYVKKLITRPKVYMNESEGIVKEVRGEKALVITDRQEMCASCVAKNFCHMLGGGKEVLSETINPVGAKTGDMVKIGIPDGAVTKASLIVYMVPAIGFVGGASLGYFIAKLYSFNLNVSTFIGSLLGLGLSMISVRFLNNIFSKKPYYQPEITKIINPDSRECKD
jgi:sigma-E factor negative regulatory protein RseC